MLDVLTGFVEELRKAGLPVSLTESLDAAEAAKQVSLADREVLRSALGATLVKSSAHLDAFATTFDVYFSPRSSLLEVVAGDDLEQAAGLDPGGPEGSPPSAGRRSAGETGDARIDGGRLRELVADALRSGDERALALLARLSVELHAGIEPGRPVGVSYYLYRTLRGLDLDGLLAELLARAIAADAGDGDRLAGVGSGPLVGRLTSDELDARAATLRRLVEAEIRRALVADRGSAAVAKTLRRALVEDVEFMHATGEDLVRLRRALYPLARSLAVRLARRRRHRRRGTLDFRSTIRRSLSTGGVPLEPRFHATRPAKAEIVVIADVSGSVASFARFTLHLVYAMASQFSKVRTFVFVDGIDEVTKIFARSATIGEAIARVGAEADVVHLEGHSDYGHALGVFAERWGKQITTRTNVIVLGDARNNYHAPNVEALEEIARRARRLYWLNPEPRGYWGSGDSIVGRYAPHTDGVFECRNLRQLEHFVELLD